MGWLFGKKQAAELTTEQEMAREAARAALLAEGFTKREIRMVEQGEHRETYEEAQKRGCASYGATVVTGDGRVFTADGEVKNRRKKEEILTEIATGKRQRLDVNE